MQELVWFCFPCKLHERGVSLLLLAYHHVSNFCVFLCINLSVKQYVIFQVVNFKDKVGVPLDIVTNQMSVNLNDVLYECVFLLL